MTKKLPLSSLLVERGLLPDKRTASAWIMARKVRVADEYVTKPGTPVQADAKVAVVGLERRYVSRGGDKLAAALERFQISLTDRVVLDAGASTGGFTDCALQHGASRVYSVDVGFGQLRGALATDPRVVALERTNIGDVRGSMLDPPIDVCCADLSYLSLSKSLPILVPLFRGEPQIAHLVKPLFEGHTLESVSDRGALEEMLVRVAGFGAENGLTLHDLMLSPVLGSNGTIEFFAWFRGDGTAAPRPVADLARDAVAAVEHVEGTRS